MKLLILILFISTHAMAFRLNTSNSAAFNKKEVKIYITSNSTCTNAGVTASELLDIAVDSVKKFWNKVPTSNLRLKRGGTYQTTDTKFLTEKLCASDDDTTCPAATSVPQVSHIVIACNNNTTDNFPSSSYLALSAPTKLSGSSIKGSVILINDSANSTFGNLSRSEMESVLAHEIGHAIGLGHSNKKEALMYYKNSDKMSRLAQDDIDGVTYLYPNKMDGCSPLAPIFGGTVKSQKPPKNPLTGSLKFPLFLLIGLSIGFLSIYLVKILSYLVIWRRQTLAS